MKNYFKQSSIKPGGAELNQCSELMARIDDFAPSDASVSAIIHRMADGMYHTMIPVRASHSSFSSGKFYAEGKSRSLISSLKAAQSEMLNKLKEWKSNRY